MEDHFAIDLHTDWRLWNLRPLPIEEYERYLQSAKWAAKCELTFTIHGRACLACGSTDDLEVHHRTYERFGIESCRDDLRPLCGTCRKDLHEGREESMCDLAEYTDFFIEQRRRGRV